MSSSNIPSLSSTLTSVQLMCNLCFSLVYLIFGTTGCFLNILLFTRRQFRTISCCTCFKLSITDFLASSIVMFTIVTFYGTTTLYAYYYGSASNYSQVYCKVYPYVIHLCAIMFRWTLAAASMDRYALSSANANLRRFVNVYIAYRVVIIIGIMSIVFPIHDLIVYDLKGNVCSIVYGYPLTLYNATFTVITASIIPISIMVICSLLIRRNLAIKRKLRQVNVGQQLGTNDREYQQRKRDQQALVMLFTQVIIYIILTVPYTICGIYNAISLNIPNKSADRLAIERFVVSVSGLVITLFPTSSFYLYTLTSKMYRKELFIMLKFCQCCINNRRIQPIR